jgi:hypothetical protein
MLAILYAGRSCYFQYLLDTVDADKVNSLAIYRYCQDLDIEGKDNISKRRSLDRYSWLAD